MAEGARGQRIDGARWLLHLLAVVLRRKIQKLRRTGSLQNRPRPGAREPGELVTGVGSADLIVLSPLSCPVSHSQHSHACWPLSPGRSLDNHRTQNQRRGIPCMLLCGFSLLCLFSPLSFVPQPLQPATDISANDLRKGDGSRPRASMEAHQFHPTRCPKWSRASAIGRHIFPTQFHMVVLS